MKYRELREAEGGDTSDTVRKRVVAARERQIARYQGEKIYANAQMSTRQVRKYCDLTPDCERLLENAVNRLGLSRAPTIESSKWREPSPTSRARSRSATRIFPKPSSIGRLIGIIGRDSD